MNAPLTQKEMGRRIAAVRKLKGLSQEELARLIEIARPALTQMEGGNRGIDIFELHRISKTLGFSLDRFMARDFSFAEEWQAPPAQAFTEEAERVSVPELQIVKFKNVLLYLLEHCAGKPNVGEASLHKLLYFCDFNHFEIHETQLTGASYLKLSTGPILQKMDALLQSMREEGLLKHFKTEYYGFAQMRYLPLVKADLRLLLASEKETIDRVIEHMSDWSTSSLNEYALMDLPCRATHEGKVIDYELVFYREVPFSVRNYGDEPQPL